MYTPRLEGETCENCCRKLAGGESVSDWENRLDDVNKHCLAEFRKHWECLDNNNQQLWQCRKFERPLNKCVFDNLVRYAGGASGAVETRFATDVLITLQKLEKKIPGAPENEVPVHERKRQIYAHSITTQ